MTGVLNPKSNGFLLGLLIGIVATGLLEGVVFSDQTLKEKFWDNPGIIFGYHVHHSTLGILGIITGFILLFRRSHAAYLLLGIGLGIIIIHTITDGRLVFIE